MIYKEKFDIWRLIHDSPRSGSFNMAADQVLLDRFIYDPKPVFRIYEWECPTISIGKNEVLDQNIDLFQCEKLGIPVIRRETGGKSVLHGFDMTYSIVRGLSNINNVSVIENYRYISKGFFRFFEKLGLNPEYFCGTKKHKNFENHVCFAVPAISEILVEGKKIIGNAQKVKKIRNTNESFSRVILQHGSIPIKDKISLIAKIFPKENLNSLRKKMNSLESMGVSPRLSNKKIKYLLKNSFKEIFNLNWEKKTWINEERKFIDICEKKFKPLDIL